MVEVMGSENEIVDMILLERWWVPDEILPLDLKDAPFLYPVENFRFQYTPVAICDLRLSIDSTLEQ